MKRLILVLILTAAMLLMCSCGLFQPEEPEPTPEIIGLQTDGGTVQQTPTAEPQAELPTQQPDAQADDGQAAQLLADGQTDPVDPVPTDPAVDGTSQPVPTDSAPTDAGAATATGEPTAQTDQAVPDTASEPPASIPAETTGGTAVAFMLPSVSSFTDFINAFLADAKATLEEQGVTILEYYTTDADSEVNNIYSAIGAGAQCIALMPTHTDSLGDALNECYMQGIPVISLMQPSEGTSTLVSPDFNEMGTLLADMVHAALPDGSSTLYVTNSSVPLINQLIRDGYTAQAETYENISLRSSLLLNTGSSDGYDKITAALGDENISSVVIVDENVSSEAARAVQAVTGREINLFTVGGGRTVLGMVGDGQIYASVFASPYQLAESACEYIMAALSGTLQSPAYAGLKTEVINAESAASYTLTGEYVDVLSPQDTVTVHVADVAGSEETDDTDQADDDEANDE